MGLTLIAAAQMGLLLGAVYLSPSGGLGLRLSLFSLGVSATSFLAAYLIATYRHGLQVERWVLERTAQLQEANTRLEEMGRLKDEFVALVSHELRTPLAVMKEGVAQLLDGLCGEITADQRETLTITLRNVDRLKLLIEDLLDLSKIEAGKMPISRRPFNLSELFEEVSQAFVNRAGEKGLKLRMPPTDRPVRVEADRDRIAQVLLNLVDNAVKFTDEGEVEVSVEEGAAEIVCSVSDTGQGIAAENLPKLFQKFQQFQRAGRNGEKGTGIGLAICKGIVELHGGRIWAESQPGQGTKIRFSLPVGSTR